MLAQVLELSGLNDELVDLGDDLEVLVGLEVAARELLADAVQHLDGARILQLCRVAAGAAAHTHAHAHAHAAAEVRRVVVGSPHAVDGARIGARPGSRIGWATAGTPASVRLLLLMLRPVLATRRLLRREIGGGRIAGLEDAGPTGTTAGASGNGRRVVVGVEVRANR